MYGASAEIWARVPVLPAETVRRSSPGSFVDDKDRDNDWGLDDGKSCLISDRADLAIELLTAHPSEMPKLLDLVFKLWVESHAKQLICGSDLTIASVRPTFSGQKKVSRKETTRKKESRKMGI